MEIPTESFLAKGNHNPGQICTQLKAELSDYYDVRENAVRNCFNQYKAEVDKLKPSTDDDSRSLLMEKRSKLRYYQQELDVEKIIRERSIKVKFLFFFNLKKYNHFMFVKLKLGCGRKMQTIRINMNR